MFRFTIRDVLWLTVVVAVGVGWWADRGQIDWQRARWRRLSELYEEYEVKRSELVQKSSELNALEAKIKAMEGQWTEYEVLMQKRREAALRDARKILGEGNEQPDLRYFSPEPLPANAL